MIAKPVSYDRRRAMTLIEVVLSAALAAMLMAALVGVVRATDRQVKLADRARATNWPDHFVDLLHRDLLTASSVHHVDGDLVMTGELASYVMPQSFVSEVRYDVEQAGGDQSVLRRQEGSHSELIATEVSRIVVERLDSDLRPQPLPPIPGPVPSRVRIWIWSDIEDLPILTRDLVIW